MYNASGLEYYRHPDRLGSSRTMVQAGQTAVCGVYPERSRRNADFYPFGGERDITNTCTQNYKFEGKERDTETGNDDFGARYYTSRLGRWLSADWSAVPAPVPYANLTNPQTLNLYAMVSDNPETFADLDGHCGDVTVAGTPPVACSNPPANSPDLPGEGANTGTGTGTSTTQQAQLSAADVTKIIKSAQASGADPTTLGMKIFSSLGNNVSVTGDALRQGVKDSNVKLDDTTNALLANVTSVTKSGDQVTITNSQKSTQDISGYAVSIAKTVSFAVGTSKAGLPGLYNVKGISAAQGGLSGNISKAEITMQGSHRFMEFSVTKYGIPVPYLHPELPMD
ncbi:MAG: RHS repeat-associated core domain-containing protein [Candidatus Acidiferrales bacterium]